MDEPSLEDLGALLQAYLNCLELCRAFRKQTDDPDVRAALGTLIDDLQEPLASLASRLRRRGVASGAYELDRQGKTTLRELLGTRSLPEQLLTVRGSLANLVAWYSEHLPADQKDPSIRDWLASLSTQTRGLLESWDRHIKEMKATYLLSAGHS
jgi:hypothetical protein